MAPGSHLVISHIIGERDPEGLDEAIKTYNRATSTVTLRTTEEVRQLFTGFQLVEPGIVPLGQWQAGEPVPTPDPTALGVAGVARLAR